MQPYQTTSWHRIQSRLPSLKAKQPGFADHLVEIARPAQLAFEALMSAYGGQPIGIECKSDSREAWAFVVPNIPNMYESSPFRMQIFDADGFSSHHGFKTLELAVEDMIVSGYRTIDVGALDRAAATERWRIAVLRMDVMQRHQEGRIDWPTTVRLLNQLPTVQAGTTQTVSV